MVKQKSNRKEKYAKTRNSPQVSAKKDSGTPIFKQLFILLGSFIFISILYNEVAGYNWVINKFLKENLDVIREHEDASIVERYRAKLGMNYTYLQYLVNNTPEDAIILMPPKDVVFTKDKKSTFKNKNPYLISRKTTSSYFTYPRKLVYEDEKDTNALYDKVTHVAIINGWGYHLLDYEPESKTPHTVLPIKKPLQSTLTK